MGLMCGDNGMGPSSHTPELSAVTLINISLQVACIPNIEQRSFYSKAKRFGGNANRHHARRFGGTPTILAV